MKVAPLRAGAARPVRMRDAFARTIDETRFRASDENLPCLFGALSIAALGVWVVALAILRNGHLQSLDVELLRMVGTLRSDELDAFFRTVDALQTPVIATVIGASVVAFAWRRSWMNAITMLAVIPGGMLANLASKGILHRDRPGLPRLVAAHGYSFPSGHAVAMTLVCVYLLMAVFVLTKNRSLRASATTAAFMVVAVVGFSRVYLQVHYPSDVVGGILAGSAWALGCLLVIGSVEHRTSAVWRPADGSAGR